MNEKFKKMDLKELNFPETVFSSDIESKVFQGIVAHVISQIEGIQLVSKGLIDSLLNRDALENFSAIFIEQDEKQHSISIKIEIDIQFGVSIPEKAEEVQSKIIKAISSYCGLHVSSIHLIFKNIISEKKEDKINTSEDSKSINKYEGF
jgi:uncharacterized alkaline shock family protein YloU